MQTLTWLRLPRALAVIPLLVVLTILHCGTAQATVLTWTLQEARFDDGTFAVGTFTFDFVTKTCHGMNAKPSGSTEWRTTDN